MAVKLSGIETTVSAPGNPDKYTGKYPNASEEYRSLVVFMKEHFPGCDFHLTDGPDMVAVVPNKNGKGYREVFSDFDFYTKSGGFCPRDKIPEENVIEMLRDDGIFVSECYDFLDELPDEL